MKKFVVLPLLLLVFGATAAFAQMETAGPMWAFGAHGGYGLPTGDFKDVYDGGLTVGASGCYMFTGNYGLELAVEWSKFPVTDAYLDLLKALPGVTDADANFQFLPVTFDFVANFPMGGPVAPYLKGGLGMYFETAEVEINGEKDTATENDFGFNLGGGVKFPLSETTVIDVGGCFHNVMTEDESTQYFTISAGVGFMF